MTRFGSYRFQVDTGIPMPPAATGKRWLYPFDAMQVGDSFLVPWEDGDRSKIRIRVQVACSARGRRCRQRYITRQLADGIRVWRAE